MDTKSTELKSPSSVGQIVIIGLLVATFMLLVGVDIRLYSEQQATQRANQIVLEQLYESQSQMGQVVTNFEGECFGINAEDRELCTMKYVIRQNAILSNELTDIGKLIGQ